MVSAIPKVPALAARLRRNRVGLMLGAAMVAIVAGECVLAWTTYGTADVLIFSTFAATVRDVGPIHIYGLAEAGLNTYNHPPLVGWWLVVVNGLTELGLPFSFVIRLPAILAHAATVPLVFVVLRRRTSPRIALTSAMLVAASPMLVILSGFHGNNDPVVALFTILSVYLLVDRRAPVWAGAAFAVAISIKIVPVIALPLLLVAAARLEKGYLGRFVGGGLPVFGAIWARVLVQEGGGFVRHVLAYNGEGFPRVWGLYDIGDWTGVPSAALHGYATIGAYVVLAVAAAVPAILVWPAPRRAPAAVGLAFSLFLTLTPSWAPQYLAWIGATVFLIEFWSATAFTVGVGSIYTYLYAYWNGFRPWTVGNVGPPTAGQRPFLVLAWALTAATAVAGVLALRRRHRPRHACLESTVDPQPDMLPVASSSSESR